jgi:hypothetical protein
MSLVNVMDPKTREVVVVDTEKCTDWQQKFLHRSGVPFETDIEVKVSKLKELSQDDLEAIVKEETKVELTAEAQSLEELRSEYIEVTGKQISIRYKNDREWLAQKIYEAKQ